jgi:hypothetical protein
MVTSQEVKVGSGTLTFGGKVASGIFFDSDDAVKETETHLRINSGYIGEDGRVRMWNESDSGNALRADLTATYTNDNIGFRIRLRADDTLFGDTQPVLGRFAYGWVNLFNEGLKFTGGFIDLSDNVWGTLGDGDWDIGGNGVRLEVKPFQFFNLNTETFGSLNLGAFIRVPLKTNPSLGRDENLQRVYRTPTLERTLGETVIGFRYTHPWFYAGLQLELDSDIDGIDMFEGLGDIQAADYVWSSAADEARFMFGAGLTHPEFLPGIFFSIEGNFEGLGNTEARGKTDLRQTLSYDIWKFTVGLKAQEILWRYDLVKNFNVAYYDFELTPWTQFKPFVDFHVNDEFTAGLELGFGGGHYVTGKIVPTTGGPTVTTPTSTAPSDKTFGVVNEESNFYIKPNLSYTFGKGLELKAWYKFTLIKYADLGDAPQLVDRHYSDIPRTIENVETILVDSLQKNQLAIEFVWSF